MTPTITRQAKSTGMKSRQVQAKVPSRFASFPVNAEEQVRQFREARKARETERLEKLRDSRLKNSSAAASTVSASISITSFASSSCPPSKPRVLGVLLNKSQASSTTIKSSALSQRSQPCQRTTHHLTETSSNNNPNAATKCMPALNLPSPLRARLAEWLEKRDHSLDNFKHLKCFGVLGPVVKRPQTPFRKAILSTSTLRAIPESSESTSLNEKVEDTYEEDDIGLNSTFTLEDEDKENICGGFETQMQVQNTTVGNLPLSPNTQRIKDLDQAHGVLSELHRLIKMAYPTEQCGLWLKAIRRRFPQCGEEPIYWECLASLEEIRGDFESAVTCYERAILQGAESCVQSSLDQLHQKMSDLHIEPIPSTNMNNVKRTQNNLPQSKNIIKSSSIQFAVHEKCGSSKKTVIDENKADPVFTATPVRRSMRLAGTPSKGTPGITCVRSLEFLEPKIKNSLIFHGNSALDPNEMKC